MEKLFDWAQTGASPLAAYATALLARALSVQEVAAKHLQDAAHLVRSHATTLPVHSVTTSSYFILISIKMFYFTFLICVFNELFNFIPLR